MKIYILFSFTSFFILCSGKCKFTLNETDNFQPVIIDPNLYDYKKLSFNSISETIEFEKGEEVILSCPQSYIMIQGNTRQPDMKFKCNSKDLFNVIKDKNEIDDYFDYNSKDIRCSIVFIEYEDECSNHGQLYNVGVLIENSIIGKIENLGIFQSCYDTTIDQVIYTKHKLGFTITYNETLSDFEYFDAIDSNGTVIASAAWFNDLYNNQEYALEYLIGENNLIDDEKNQYILKGEFVPLLDLKNNLLRSSTMRFINVAPQWKTIKTGSWSLIENKVRKYLEINKNNIVITTGTWGILELPDVTGYLKYIFLDIYDEVQKHPVPKLFWKGYIDTGTNTGLVYIVHNNPFEEITGSMQKCRNQCPDAPVINPTQDDVKRGYWYCCTIEDFLDQNDFMHLKDAFAL